MAEAGLDTIHIRDLRVRCVIGVFPEERRDRQDVMLNIQMCADLRKPGSTDCIEDAVDYRQVTKRILALAEDSAFYLVEALAERVAQLCLEDERVCLVRVSVEKPGSFAVRAIRGRGNRSRT